MRVSFFSVPLKTSSSSTIIHAPTSPVASICNVICASAGISDVAVASAICVGSMEPVTVVGEMTSVGSTTVAAVVGACSVCAKVGMPVGVLFAGMVAVTVGVVVGVPGPANGFVKF